MQNGPKIGQNGQPEQNDKYSQFMKSAVQKATKANAIALPDIVLAEVGGRVLESMEFLSKIAGDKRFEILRSMFDGVFEELMNIESAKSNVIAPPIDIPIDPPTGEQE